MTITTSFRGSARKSLGLVGQIPENMIFTANHLGTRVTGFRTGTRYVFLNGYKLGISKLNSPEFENVKVYDSMDILLGA